MAMLNALYAAKGSVDYRIKPGGDEYERILSPNVTAGKPCAA